MARRACVAARDLSDRRRHGDIATSRLCTTCCYRIRYGRRGRRLRLSAATCSSSSSSCVRHRSIIRPLSDRVSAAASVHSLIYAVGDRCGAVGQCAQGGGRSWVCGWWRSCCGTSGAPAAAAAAAIVSIEILSWSESPIAFHPFRFLLFFPFMCSFFCVAFYGIVWLSTNCERSSFFIHQRPCAL